MKQRTFLLFFIFFLAPFSLAFGEEPQVEIKNYEATITLLDRDDDINVMLEITYDIMAGVKSGGFKELGSERPTNIMGNEENALLAVELLWDKSYRLAWRFTPQETGEKKIRINFKLQDVLTSQGQANVLNLPWIGKFKTPVRHAVYRIVFPIGLDPGIKDASSQYHIAQDNFGRSVVTVESLAPKIPESFRIVFSPAIVDVSPVFSSAQHFLESHRLKIVMAFVVLLFFVSTWIARKSSQA